MKIGILEVPVPQLPNSPNEIMSTDQMPSGSGVSAVAQGVLRLKMSENGARLRARCWGTRGSMPTPGIGTAGFGGNTSCVEVEAAGRRFIFDAGSGIRLLGEELLRKDEAIRAEVFLTHFHWDHIQGLPFFGPLYNPNTRIRVHGAMQGGIDIRTLIAGQMGPIYFPVPFETVEAHMDFVHLTGATWHEPGVEVDAIRVRHPADTYGYRIRCGGASIAYIPDNELVGGEYALDARKTYRDLVAFLDGVDLLLHDAMFTNEEYGRREGWGHSTFEQAIQLAEDAGVGRLFLFHHAPERTDADLTRIAEELRDDLARRGSSLELDVAEEGEDLFVQEPVK
jgi:phosphoribosyl 1,2-cyclic phosphodiesterase